MSKASKSASRRKLQADHAEPATDFVSAADKLEHDEAHAREMKVTSFCVVVTVAD